MRLATPRPRLAVLAVAVAIVLLCGCSSGDDEAANNDGSANPPQETTQSSDVTRVTGEGSCAFLSIEDVKKATGAARVELRQSTGPSGNPGCEWVVGDDRRVLQLEFQISPEPSPLPEGEETFGPWKVAKWDASTRTLHVDAGGQVLFVRASDADPTRAKDVCIAVATLVAERN